MPNVILLRALRGIAIAACLASLISGCSKTSERPLHETPCGKGKLVLTLKEVTHPPAPSDVKFTLALVEGGNRRVVDVLKPRATLWAKPVASERFTRLRSGPDNWPVFVNSRDFTPAEYEQIRDRLQAAHDEFDAAGAQARTGVSADYGNELQLSSTRYVNYESFRRTYTGSQPKVTVSIYPDGGVWLHHPRGAIRIGGVVESGRKVVLGLDAGPSPVSGVSDTAAYALAAVDEHQRKISDEFAVAKLSPSECESAIARERAERAQ
jgi:hypothetical protein